MDYNSVNYKDDITIDNWIAFIDWLAINFKDEENYVTVEEILIKHNLKDNLI